MLSLIAALCLGQGKFSDLFPPRPLPPPLVAPAAPAPPAEWPVRPPPPPLSSDWPARRLGPRIRTAALPSLPEDVFAAERPRVVRVAAQDPPRAAPAPVPDPKAMPVPAGIRHPAPPPLPSKTLPGPAPPSGQAYQAPVYYQTPTTYYTTAPVYYTTAPAPYQAGVDCAGGSCAMPTYRGGRRGRFR